MNIKMPSCATSALLESFVDISGFDKIPCVDSNT